MIERLDELNRVLDAAIALGGAGPGQSFPLDSLLRVCRSNVRHGLLPNHEQSVQFASSLGLLRRIGSDLQITDSGLLFMSFNPARYYELTPEQAWYLARHHYLGGTFAEDCRKVFRSFAVSDNPPKLVWSEVDDGAIDAEAWLLSHLCQLNLISRVDSGYESSPTSAVALLNFVDEPKGLTEERLRELLLEREALGDVGEQLAMAFERRRLIEAGHVVEAHCIRRISKLRVNAGYDLESFDGQAPSGSFDRFIEVKASRSNELRFYWTENEMKVAQQLGTRYWIYYFGGVNESGDTDLPPILFQDPMQCVMNNNELTKMAQGLFVQGKRAGATNEH